jgi:hypothetical protein
MWLEKKGGGAVEEGGDVLKTKTRERRSPSKGQQALRQTGITGIIYLIFEVLHFAMSICF